MIKPRKKFTICRELPDCFSCGDPPSIEWDCLGEEYACILYDQSTYEISGPDCWDGPAGTPTPVAFVLIENTQCVFRFDVLTMPDCSDGIIDDDLEIRPNPVSDLIIIDGLNRNATYDIFDFSGRVLQSGKLNTNKKVLNVAQLPDGIYIIRFVDDSGELTAVKRVIKDASANSNY